MATLIPAFSSCSQRMTAGERRFAERLQQKLEDDYLLWYDVPIGRKRQRPDFMILHPQRGIIVLEVKDWKLSTIQRIDLVEADLLTDRGLVTERNPLKQARDNTLAIVRLLERDPLLIQTEGSHREKLAFPYSYGAVLTNITRKQFESQPELADVLEPNLVICQDEMYESADAYEFQQRLWNLCTYNFGEPLTLARLIAFAGIFSQKSALAITP